MATSGADHDDIMRRFREQLDTMGAAELRALLPTLLDMGGRTLEEPPRRPARRRPRRETAVTYRVRADLKDTTPPLWRRLELASDLTLDQVHVVLQVAFGWTDSHLHQFGSGPDYYDRETEYYLCPFEVDEGSDGVPEQDVRLDEVLVDVGDRLFYLYDFGDGWLHTLRLDAVLPRAADAPRAVCTGGRRPGPAEDCGGVDGYELFAAANEATGTRRDAAVAELARVFGPDVDPRRFAPVPFDIEQVNAELTGAGAAAELPAPVAALLDSVRDRATRQHLLRMVEDASAAPPEIDEATAARAVAPYAWLLDRVGDDGLALTSAGYLRPAEVTAAAEALGIADEWIGKLNREVQTYPVLALRESAQKAGLVRKHKGRLLRTAAGHRLRTDPLGLWWHLAGRVPFGRAGSIDHQAGLIALIIAAAGATGSPTRAEVLTDIGWREGAGHPITPSSVWRTSMDTDFVVERMGGRRRGHRGPAERPTADEVVFARAALQTWP